MRIGVLANWGLGLCLLETLAATPGVTIAFVVTRFDPDGCDPWGNAVHGFAAGQGYEIHHEHEVSFGLLGQLIESRGVDLLLAHSFMRILPERVFSLPPRGTVNLHASLLPRHRGPAPTHWVLANQEPKTGITSHFMDRGVDTGGIISQVEVPVLPGDSVATIIERQKLVLPQLVRETLDALRDPAFLPRKQCEAAATYAPRPTS